jgi:hypothetical protein
MKIERFSINSCCGAKSLIFKTNRPIAKSDIISLVNQGFIESENFTKAGIMYLTNEALIVSGPLGSDRLQVKCKSTSSCQEKVNDLEVILQQLG